MDTYDGLLAQLGLQDHQIPHQVGLDIHHMPLALLADYMPAQELARRYWRHYFAGVCALACTARAPPP